MVLEENCEISKGYIPKRNNLREEKWRCILEDKTNEFIQDNDWRYDFGLELVQPDGQHPEARYLSQMVFKKLFEISGFELEITSKRFSILKNGEQEMCIHYDVMNNAKVGNNKRLASKLGEESEYRMEWEKIYHTIGNFAPIPWPTLNESKDLQVFHNSFCKEDWDRMLFEMQKRWNTWHDKGDIVISFLDYIIGTCQQMYCKTIFSGLKNEPKGISWLERANNWNELLREEWEKTKRLELVDIVNCPDIEQQAKDITDLISMRGEMILSLLCSRS